MSTDGADMPFARTGLFITITLSALGAGGQELAAQAPSSQFHLMEATIPDVHRAIREGQVTCRGLVQAYLNRAKAYNGTCNQLVTEDMASRFLPNYSEYKAAVAATAGLRDGDPGKTPPIDFGRIEPAPAHPRGPPDGGEGVRQDGRHAQRGAGGGAGDAQHPRRALGHLQGRLRPASIGGAPAARGAKSWRGIPPPAGRARACRRARPPVRPQP